MLPNQIVLTVDPGTGSVTKTYDRYAEGGDRTVYKEQNGSLVTKDHLTFYRTLPKRNGNFLGVAKSAAKFHVDETVVDAEGNNTTAPVIIQVSLSVPVGVTAVTTDLLRRYLAALLIHDDMDKLVDNLEV